MTKLSLKCNDVGGQTEIIRFFHSWIRKQSKNRFSPNKWAGTKPALWLKSNTSLLKHFLLRTHDRSWAWSNTRKQRFSGCFQHPTTANKRNSTRPAGCSIYRSMSPPHRVLAFHSNLHLLAMSLSSWVVSNWTPVPARATLSNPVHENSLEAGRHDAVVCLCTGC